MKTALSKETMIVDTAFSPSEAINLFLHYDYSLILFDIDKGARCQPGIPALEVRLTHLTVNLFDPKIVRNIKRLAGKNRQSFVRFFHQFKQE